MYSSLRLWYILFIRMLTKREISRGLRSCNFKKYAVAIELNVYIRVSVRMYVCSVCLRLKYSVLYRSACIVVTKHK